MILAADERGLSVVGDRRGHGFCITVTAQSSLRDSGFASLTPSAEALGYSHSRLRRWLCEHRGLQNEDYCSTVPALRQVASVLSVENQMMPLVSEQKARTPLPPGVMGTAADW